MGELNRAIKKFALVVDDDPDIRDFVVETLRSDGFEVLSAADGLEGKTVFDSNPPVELVVADILMPDEDGIQLIRKIRQSKRGEPKIIAVSGGGFLNADLYLTTASAMGADMMLQKPFTAKDLLSAVHRLGVGPSVI